MEALDMPFEQQRRQQRSILHINRILVMISITYSDVWGVFLVR
jgi:hypothetical protein